MQNMMFKFYNIKYVYVSCKIKWYVMYIKCIL